MLITQVIQAGIKWLLSLLIPGAGFIKAIMAIKDLIVFFVESAMMLIPAITEAILALAAGSVAGVAKAIEFGLAKLIGLVINLFAKLIGLGGLSKKVQGIFKKIRKRVDKAVSKLLKKARKAGRKLMRKLGIGKKKRTEKDDKRTDKQKKDDLHKGVIEASNFVKSGQKEKKEIDKQFNKLEGKYLLKELKLVTDKQEKDGNQIVHVYGKINPEENGNSFKIDFKNHENLTPEEETRLKRIPGGAELLIQIDKLKDRNDEASKRDLKGYLGEARTAFGMLDDKRGPIKIGAKLFSPASFEKTRTEIDILNESEMIEVKTSEKYGDPKTKSLESDHKTQFARLAQIFKGTLKLVHEDGTPFEPPKKFIYQFSVKKVSPKVKEWLLSRGVTEVREGK